MFMKPSLETDVFLPDARPKRADVPPITVARHTALTGMTRLATNHPGTP